MAAPDTLAPVSAEPDTWTVLLDGTQTDDTLVQTLHHADVLVRVQASGTPDATDPGLTLRPAREGGETVIPAGTRALGLVPGKRGTFVLQPLAS